jgi:methylase of polypeptide subunit release factors
MEKFCNNQGLFWTSAVVLFFLPFVSRASTLESLYHRARQVRTLQGHKAAESLYDEILKLNPDDATAATRSARHSSSPRRHDQLGNAGSLAEKVFFTDQLRAYNFTPDVIADLIFPTNSKKAKHSTAPLYLQPLRAGSKVPPLPTCALSCCIQLFLIAACVPIATCHKNLGKEMVELLQKLGLAFEDDGWMVPYCHIMPIRVAKTTLYLATDLHPNVLSMTCVGGKNEGAVMYIGPDSVALVDHWNSRQQQEVFHRHVVDIGTGSGIQALSFSATSKAAKVTCVDINPRALRLTSLNFEWNRMVEPTLILGDIRESTGVLYGTGRTLPWLQLFGTPTAILSNPPFLPVPVKDATISRRYGWFSSGDTGGEAVLQRVVELASDCLDPSNGVLAVVSEFMNPQTDFEARLKVWWGTSSHAGKSLLFTNQHALGAAAYAERRADSEEEAEQWIQNLEDEKITHVSPGLLFVKKCQECQNTKGLELDHELLPKTEQGSIWTPTNRFGRDFTARRLATSFLGPS